MIKGRWFLWAPLILAVVYKIYNLYTVSEEVQNILDVIFLCIVGVIAFYYVVNTFVVLWDYCEGEDILSTYNWFYKASLVILVIKLNRYLDKHLTIKR